ncbi:hypothetical protein [Streptomyces sp. NPDC093111]|uniref:hypothetical protein n=1 Tax=Streptomyces sp. NPDC093111 TaxID=3154978 RepID=UPI003414C59E
MLRSLVTATLVAALAATSLGAAQAAEISPGAAKSGAVMHLLPYPEGHAAANAELMNDAGQIVGSTTDGRGTYTATRWEADLSITPLKALNATGTLIITKALAPDGTVAGAADTGDRVDHAVTWDASGTPKRLEEPAGYVNSTANDINGGHVVVGVVSDNRAARAVRWGPDGRATLLPLPPLTRYSEALYVDERGVAYGWASHSSGANKQAVRWDTSGNVTNLGTFGGQWSEVRDVNDQGTAVGSAGAPGYESWAAVAPPSGTYQQLPGGVHDSTAIAVNNHGDVLGAVNAQRVLWRNGGMTALRPLPDTRSLEAYELNDSGMSVGKSGDFATVWDASGTPTPLPTGPRVDYSYGLRINNSGQVLGWAATWDYGRQAVVWR